MTRLRHVALLAVVLGGCSPGSPKEPTPVSAPSPGLNAQPAGGADAALATIDAASLRRIVSFLASDELAGRRTPSPGLKAAAAYIAEGFRELDLTTLPEAPGYLQTFDCGGRGQSSNVLGLLEGQSRDPLIVVSAHYDHLGDRAPGSDKIYNGANDNASGVAAMLLVAQALKRRPEPLAGTVLFAAFCGEERGLLGSQHFVAAPPLPLHEIDGVLNLEMLGRPGAETPPTAWLTGYAYSNMGPRLASVAQEHDARVLDAKTVGKVEGDAFDRSDNYPFATAGIVAHTIAAGRIDELYHSADDELRALEFEPMAVLVRAIASGVARIAEPDPAEPTPTLQWTHAGNAAGFGPTGH